MNIIEMPIAELKPYKNNAKIHNKKQVEMIAKSLSEFGWQQPIVIDRDNVIIAGHGRYAAAKQLGLEEAPCKYADELTEDQIKAYRLIDNRISEGEYDLSLEIAELQTIELDMSQFNFDMPELEMQIQELEEQHQHFTQKRWESNG